MAGSGAGAGPRVQQKDTLAYEAVHRKELRYGDTASSSAAAAVLMAATRLVHRWVGFCKPEHNVVATCDPGVGE